MKTMNFDIVPSFFVHTLPITVLTARNIKVQTGFSKYLSQPSKDSLQSLKSISTVKSTSTVNSNVSYNSDFESLEVLQRIRFDRLKMLRERLKEEREMNKEHQMKTYKVKLVGSGGQKTVGVRNCRIDVDTLSKAESFFWERSKSSRPHGNKNRKKNFIKLNKMAVSRGRRQWD